MTQVKQLRYRSKEIESYSESNYFYKLNSPRGSQLRIIPELEALQWINDICWWEV